MSHNLQIHTLSENDFARWDAYVNRHPQATFFHLSGWKTVLEEGVRHPCHFLYAERDGEIVGVYPLAQIKSWLFGNSLVSLPFCVYGGIVADDESAFTALDEAGKLLADKLDVEHLETRDLTPQHSDWPSKDMYVTFRKAISNDDDENMQAIPRKQRAMVRKGIKLGLEPTIDEQLDDFLFCYESSVRNLGTPIFPRRYFQLLQRVFGEQCEILTVRHQGRPATSVMSFYFRDQVLPYYGGGTAEARNLAANDFMYWSLMSHAAQQRDVRLFDYGRSKKGTGAYNFKKYWGFEPEPLHYSFYLRKRDELPEVNPLNPKYRLFIEAWKRMPLSMARIVGPVISRNLG